MDPHEYATPMMAEPGEAEALVEADGPSVSRCHLEMNPSHMLLVKRIEQPLH
jgi:hypothetical protein